MQQAVTTGRARINVSATYYSSGSITIPAGVTSITLVGQGGSGIIVQGEMLTPGQPGIAGTAARWTYQGGSAQDNYDTIGASGANPLNFYSSVPGRAISTLGQQVGTASGGYLYPWNQGSAYTINASFSIVVNSSNSAAGYHYHNGGAGNQGGVTITAGYILTTDGTDGQPYIAPTYGPDTYTTGANTTASLNGQPYTWSGGYGGAGSPASYSNISVPGTGHTLSYTVGSGGYVQVAYSY